MQRPGWELPEAVWRSDPSEIVILTLKDPGSFLTPGNALNSLEAHQDASILIVVSTKVRGQWTARLVY